MVFSAFVKYIKLIYRKFEEKLSVLSHKVLQNNVPGLLHSLEFYDIFQVEDFFYISQI